ncbi:nuclear transport factor 2 family protein [Nocardiopsis sediminis]|uniref:Nuclear transport factor 2 family protein n=1 Tax=Nocardiopsis sediminis TaxID=1778267 RepID=A0ABV8FJV1_9ACTN
MVRPINFPAPHGGATTSTPDSDSLDRLQRRVDRLADRADLADLLARQGRWLDGKRWGDVRTVFTEDAVGAFPAEEVSGADRLAAHAARSHDGHHRTHHVTGDPLIEIDGDRATVSAPLVAVFIRGAADTRPEFAVGERYRFEAERTPDGWRFSRVEIQPLWRIDGDVPAPAAG